jgi:hypothetical protein
MRGHSSNELQYHASILGPDGATVISSGIACGIEDLSGRRLEQAQLVASETSHMILMHYGDVAALSNSGYLLDGEGLLYLVDYTRDPREPRAKMWLEIYCHIERSGN